MVDKRGWLRIVEALVSILIVFGAVLTVSITKQAGSPNDVCSIISPFLEEISRNQTLRMQILNNNSIETEQFLSSHIKNPSLERNVNCGGIFIDYYDIFCFCNMHKLFTNHC